MLRSPQIIAVTARAARMNFFMELSSVSLTVLAGRRRLPRTKASRSEVLHTSEAQQLRAFTDGLRVSDPLFRPDGRPSWRSHPTNLERNPS